MSRLFTDDSLMTWEAYPSGGDFGLPEMPKIIFNCLSDPGRRARFVEHPGDDSDAQRTIQQLPDAELLTMLEGSRELD